MSNVTQARIELSGSAPLGGSSITRTKIGTSIGTLRKRAIDAIEELSTRSEQLVAEVERLTAENAQAKDKAFTWGEAKWGEAKWQQEEE